MIEFGDIGNAVEVWQKIVGVAEDGEFGPKTKAATVAFQQKHRLDVDGIILADDRCLCDNLFIHFVYIL